MMELDQKQALFSTPHPPPATYTDRCRLPLFLIKNLKVDCIYYTFMVIGWNPNPVIYGMTSNKVQNRIFDFADVQMQLIIATSLSCDKKSMRFHVEGAGLASRSPEWSLEVTCVPRGLWHPHQTTEGSAASQPRTPSDSWAPWCGSRGSYLQVDLLLPGIPDSLTQPLVPQHVGFQVATLLKPKLWVTIAISSLSSISKPS